MKLLVKRAYEPASKADGVRILIDRLWPRGVRKADAKVDVWAKDLAPSSELRRWYHANAEKRHSKFVVAYRKELAQKRAAIRAVLGSTRTITLVTAARDIEHSHVPVFVAFARGIRH